MLLIVFTVSMFVSASLLFLVEPMFAKMALPLLGGTPAVWNTCLVFFQAVLLGGYLYAYASTRWLSRRAQVVLHLCLCILPFATFPLRIPAGWEPPPQSNPALWILAMLSVSVGLPFFLLSSSTPILQRWFSGSRHKSASDPYFLYAASNAGSLLGLLSYPLLLEPWLRLGEQSRLWSFGYAVFSFLTAVCAVMIWRGLPAAALIQPAPAEEAGKQEGGIAWRQRLRWVALAFVPSSLMLGVTTALTSDVPAIPLFWVLPLALYLLSFVLVFASRPPISHQWLVQRLPLLILVALIPVVSKTRFTALWLLILLYLMTLFAIAMVCHGEIARSRPRVDRLAEFYLWVSFGGVLGGIFNALIAPVVFTSVAEFPLVLILAALLRPVPDPKEEAPEKASRARRNDWLLPAALGLCLAAVIFVLSRTGLQAGRALTILIFGYSMLWCLSFGKRRLRFALGVTVLLAASSLYTKPYGQVLDTERSFFGVSRVANEPNGRFRYLFQGGTVHGVQSRDTAHSREPLAYYTRSGPAGIIVQAMQAKALAGSAGEARKASWAVVGLGAGAMACYALPGESLTYYEIDPTVVRIASDPRYFTFLSQCAPGARIVLGDARLRLRDAPDASYDLIALDAFSGDSIPMHLMTRESMALYMRKLAPGGMIAFHVSNLYLDLTPTLAALAGDAGLVCLLGDDTGVSQAQTDAGKFPSRWIVMARSRSDLGTLERSAHWTLVQAPAGARVWTDDYSNLLQVIKWN